jgi:pilus assembly protein Flp/PilA
MGIASLHPSYRLLRPSLRANGSRECAPDDRLREAIHTHIEQKTNLSLNSFFSAFLNAPATHANLDFVARLISKFLDDDSGATAIEYCLIAAGISIVIITAVNGIGGTLNTGFTSINTALK